MLMKKLVSGVAAFAVAASALAGLTINAGAATGTVTCSYNASASNNLNAASEVYNTDSTQTAELSFFNDVKTYSCQGVALVQFSIPAVTDSIIGATLSYDVKSSNGSRTHDIYVMPTEPTIDASYTLTLDSTKTVVDNLGLTTQILSNGNTTSTTKATYTVTNDALLEAVQAHASATEAKTITFAWTDAAKDQVLYPATCSLVLTTSSGTEKDITINYVYGDDNTAIPAASLTAAKATTSATAYTETTFEMQSTDSTAANYYPTSFTVTEDGVKYLYTYSAEGSTTSIASVSTEDSENVVTLKYTKVGYANVTVNYVVDGVDDPIATNTEEVAVGTSYTAKPSYKKIDGTYYFVKDASANYTIDSVSATSSENVINIPMVENTDETLVSYEDFEGGLGSFTGGAIKESGESGYENVLQLKKGSTDSGITFDTAISGDVITSTFDIAIGSLVNRNTTYTVTSSTGTELVKMQIRRYNGTGTSSSPYSMFALAFGGTDYVKDDVTYNTSNTSVPSAIIGETGNFSGIANNMNKITFKYNSVTGEVSLKINDADAYTATIATGLDVKSIKFYANHDNDSRPVYVDNFKVNVSSIPTQTVDATGTVVKGTGDYADDTATYYIASFTPGADTYKTPTVTWNITGATTAPTRVWDSIETVTGDTPVQFGLVVDGLGEAKTTTATMTSAE
jgi:hypothetical protein